MSNCKINFDPTSIEPNLAEEKELKVSSITNVLTMNVLINYLVRAPLGLFKTACVGTKMGQVLLPYLFVYSECNDTEQFLRVTSYREKGSIEAGFESTTSRSEATTLTRVTMTS